MIIKKLFFLLSLFLCIHTLYAQEDVNTKFEDTEKHFDVLLFNQQFTQAYNLLETQSQNINSVEIQTRIRLLHLFSKYYMVTDDIEKGKEYAEKAYHISLESKNPLAQAYGLYAMAYYYQQLNLFDMVYDNIQKIINIIDIEQHPYLAFNVYYRLYSVYTYWDDPQQTHFYAQKTLAFAIKSNNYDKLSNAYSAKAIAMENMYKHTQEKAFQDSIIYYLHKAAYTDPKHELEVPIRTKVIAKLNLANYYFQKMRGEEMANKPAQDSINKYLHAIGSIPAEIDQNYELRASILGMKSQIELTNGNLDTTEKYLLIAYDNLRKEGVRPSYTTLYNITIGLYELYKTKNDYKSAFEFLKINQSYKDSIFNENKIKEVLSLEAKYENQRIKEEVKFLEEQSRFRKIQNYLLIGICILILITLYLIRKNYLKKIALQREKAFALEKEKSEAEAQISLEKESQARMAAEQEILKLKNEKMQKEVMMNTLQIKRKNELLQEFKEELKKLDTSIDTTKILKQEKRLEESLNDTVKEFEEINPIFFQRLKDQSDNKLTALDIRYAAYFHLGLSTKEIAQIFNVEPKSIRMTKYRIKQKLNLPKEESIEEFFEKISKD